MRRPTYNLVTAFWAVTILLALLVGMSLFSGEHEFSEDKGILMTTRHDVVMRRSPSESGEPILTIPKGEEVTLTGLRSEVAGADDGPSAPTALWTQVDWVDDAGVVHRGWIPQGSLRKP